METKPIPSAEEDALESVYPEDFLGLGALAKGVFSLGKNVAGRRVKNVVVAPAPGKSNLLTGRLPESPGSVSHAYRNMSSAELQDAIATGMFRKNPSPTRNSLWDVNSKYWSSGDVEGAFGRTWKGAAEESVRVPIKKVSPNWAVKTKNAEKLNKETKTWEPFKKGGAVRAKVRGNGIATRVKKTKYF